MQLYAEKDHSAPDSYFDAAKTYAALVTEAKMDRAVLDRLDVGLFRALRKLDTPKQRVCSALWLSYAEYDELAKLIEIS